MSNGYDAITWAIRARGISAGAYRLLIALARRVGKRGFDVWPSHEKMSEDAELSVSSVRRHLAELEAARLILIVPRQRASGARSSNAYRLQVMIAHSFATGATQWVRPDDGQDDDADDGDEHVNLDRGGAQIEQGALFTGEQASELESLGTNLTEPSLTDDEIVRRFRKRWDVYPDRTATSVSKLLAVVFDRMEGSRLLRGEKTAWRPSADWLVNATNFNKIMENVYAQDFRTGDDAAAPTRPGERNHVAAGQAARDILRAHLGEPGNAAVGAE